MGKKRITALVEITYPEDEPRGLEDLRLVARNSAAIGVQGDNGTLAAFSVTSASEDPDPEPTAENPGEPKSPTGPVPDEPALTA